MSSLRIDPARVNLYIKSLRTHKIKVIANETPGIPDGFEFVEFRHGGYGYGIEYYGRRKTIFCPPDQLGLRFLRPDDTEISEVYLGENSNPINVSDLVVVGTVPYNFQPVCGK